VEFWPGERTELAMTGSANLTGVTVRGLRADDLDEADRIMRVAFGTFLGLPDPLAFMGDADYVRTRWAADPAAALAAEVDGTLVGSNFVTRWGSVGFFGPLTVLPSLWDRGVARALMGATTDVLDAWGVTHRGLYTFAGSPKHIGLYQRFGFLPRFLTPVLTRPVSGTAGAAGAAGEWTTYAALAEPEDGLAAAAGVTGSIYPGLDVRREIVSARDQNLGDTVLVYGDDGLAGFAVCHVGAGTEAGSGNCYLKFGAARAGAAAAESFGRLLDACEEFAASRGAATMVAGVSTERRRAYRVLLDRGYRAAAIGVTMHAPDAAAYHHADAYVIDDWR
jgi:GNAT superfamily N-acetyltransferase